MLNAAAFKDKRQQNGINKKVIQKASKAASNSPEFSHAYAIVHRCFSNHICSIK
jgi:hypothetical protein